MAEASLPPPVPEAGRCRRVGLRAGILLRLALAALMLALLVGLTGAWLYRSGLASDAQRMEAMTRSRYSQLLAHLEAQWQQHARRLVRRIEFARLLETPDALRWERLSIFLAAQGDMEDFANILVVSPGGRPVFAQGADAAWLAAPENLSRLGRRGTAHEDPVDGDRLYDGWVFLPERGDWHYVIRHALWLGADGNGELLLTLPLTRSSLQHMALADTRLFVQRPHLPPLAMQSDEEAFLDPAAGPLHRFEARRVLIQFELPWPGHAEFAPRFVIQRQISRAVDVRGFIWLGGGFLVAAVLLGWLVLGRWLDRLGRDVVALRAAAADFAAHGDAGQARQLLTATEARADALGDAALALGQLMVSAAAREAEQHGFVQTLSLLDEAVFELDAADRIASASPGWAGLLHQVRQVVGVPLADFILPEDRAPLDKVLAAMRAGEKLFATLRLRLAHDPGTWVELRLALDASGTMRGALRDITQTYRQEKQISYMALHDALTGLPNRVLLEERIGGALREARRRRGRIAVGFIDLDNFKLVNDGFGHETGDRLLVALARRLVGLLRENDTLARWGGDEFALLLPDVDGEAGARAVADKLIAALQQPFELEGGGAQDAFAVGVSIGLAVYPEDGETAADLLSRADRAMFLAKSRGRGQACCYAELRGREDDKRAVYIQNRLARAIEAERIDVWFQPIVGRGDGDRCALVEALARWHDEEEGWISPAVFVPIAENTGLIRSLGRQVWQKSLACLARWRAQGSHVRVAINLSKRQLVTVTLAEELLADLRTTGLSPDDVVLEVTESVAMSDPLMQKQLVGLHEAGFRLALDDFGTGYSALSQLHALPLSELKIDMSFVRRIHEADGRAMVETIVAIARTLNLKTIAEGVEDEHTAATLAHMEIDYQQGYHHAKPMSAEEFERRWLA